MHLPLHWVLGLRLTTDLLPVLRLTLHGAIPPLPSCDFMACKGTLPIPILLPNAFYIIFDILQDGSGYSNTVYYNLGGGQCHSCPQHSLSFTCPLGTAKWVIIQAVMVSAQWYDDEITSPPSQQQQQQFIVFNFSISKAWSLRNKDI